MYQVGKHKNTASNTFYLVNLSGAFVLSVHSLFLNETAADFFMM
jgi:hypothetical protein